MFVQIRRYLTIHYNLSSGNSIKLEVVDSRGKLMAVLANGFRQAGAYETVLPNTLVRGAYIIRLTTGTKKIATLQVRL